MSHRTQQHRSETSGAAPADNSLAPGEMFVELADPMSLWVGVPTSIATNGTKKLFDSVLTGQALNKHGDTADGVIVFAGGIDVTSLPCNVPNPAIDDNSSEAANTGWVMGQAEPNLPQMDGTASAGTRPRWSRGNHVHPTDTSRAPVVSPNLSGLPTAPTAATGTNNTQIATTAFVFANALPASGGTVPGGITSGGTITAQYFSVIGASAGYQFQDRTTGESWIWYAQGGSARLFDSGDKFTVSNTGEVTVSGNLHVGGNYIWLAGGGGTANTTGGPLIYADTINAVLKIGPGGGSWLFQNYAGVNTSIISSGGAATFNQSVTTTTLNVNGNAGIGGWCTIGGLQWINNGGWMQTPSLRASSQFWCDGTGYFEHNVTINDGLHVAGGMSIGGIPLYNSTGYLYTPNYFAASYVWAQGNAQVDGNLNVSGNSTVGGDLTVSGWTHTQNIDNANDIAAQGVFRRSSLAFGGARGAFVENWGGAWDAMCFAIDASSSTPALLLSSDGGHSGYYFFESGVFSDARLKENIRDSQVDALELLCQTPVRAFEWNEKGCEFRPNDAPAAAPVAVGLVAQELEETIPVAVNTHALAEGMRSIDHQRLVPYLIRAIQQLEARVALLEGKKHDG
jgi:hypothetical protein